MKYLSFLALLGLISCGEVKNTSSSSVGELLTVEPISVDSNEVTALQSICSAISNKSKKLNSLLNAPLVFSYARKGCSETNLGATQVVPTTIQNVYGGYKLIKTDGDLFYFSDLETTDSGSLSIVCSQLKSSAGVKSPIQDGTEYIYFKAFGISGDDCPEASYEKCISVSKGSANGEGLAQIHTKTFIRINVDTIQGREGFFTFKKEISSSGCERFSGETIINMAILK